MIRWLAVLVWVVGAVVLSGCAGGSAHAAKHNPAREPVAVAADGPIMKPSAYFAAVIEQMRQQANQVVTSEAANSSRFVPVADGSKPAKRFRAIMDYVVFDGSRGRLGFSDLAVGSEIAASSIDLRSVEVQVTVHFEEHLGGSRVVTAAGVGHGSESVRLRVTGEMLERWHLSGLSERDENDARIVAALTKATRGAFAEAIKRIR